MKAKTRIVLNMLVGLCLLHGCAESSVDTEALCGNGVIDPGESCDKTNIGTATCQSVLGLSDATGKLGCNPDCSFDTSSCSVRQCLSQTTYCDESKVWHYCEAGMDRTKTCGSGENTNKPYCDDALGCLAAENGCKDGETACNGSQPQICSDGHWINNGAVCPLGCNLQTHRCNDQLVSCEDDDVQCNGNTVQTCVSGTWQDASSPCPFGCTDGVCNTENRVCEEDAIQCNGAFVETCQENTWVRASSPCPFGCTDGVCNPENMTCRDGNKQCNGAIIQECSGNAWNNTITCTNGCRSGSCIHNCDATDKTCNGLQPQKCQVAETGNVYVDDGAACPFGCDASTGTCMSAKACAGLSGAVSHGTSGCVSATQYGTCNDGAWTGTKTCAPNETCDDKEGKCVSTKCSSHADCTDPNAPSCIAGKCDLCTGDEDCGESEVCNEDTMACEEAGGVVPTTIHMTTFNACPIDATDCVAPSGSTAPYKLSFTAANGVKWESASTAKNTLNIGTGANYLRLTDLKNVSKLTIKYTMGSGKANSLKFSDDKTAVGSEAELETNATVNTATEYVYDIKSGATSVEIQKGTGTNVFVISSVVVE